ncbi:putative peroxiredoxin ycf42 [Astathelohania contejeani]|uniref:Peroxiredoxin ycf42 n=1 Tax=Astathelohania contejeani TaxID=164912 RepID=A0ABQ7HZR4_9MICR|nr:putative peroxiredoxin ycf42 [Thelohania contejeani]
MKEINDYIDDFELEAYYNEGFTSIKLSDYQDKILVIIFYPYDFTFVCPTEINELSNKYNDIKDLGAEVFFVSCDSLYTHRAWAMTPRNVKGVEGVRWPMISDYNREFCKTFGLLNKDSSAMRATLIIDKHRCIRHKSIYDGLIGRSVSEIIRIIKAINYLETNEGRTCPINWDDE